MYKNGERIMAWITRINKVEKHPDADSLDICTINGWECITKLGEYKQGDLVIYLEVDSWVPHELAPFLSKGQEPREYNGVKGERLKTIKLRGQVSQGLILPIQLAYDRDPPDYDHVFIEGDDVTELLGIQKWERPISAKLSGLCRGNFPSFIQKTDQERCQSFGEKLFTQDNINSEYEVTVKLDGSSMTVYCRIEHETPGYDETAVAENVIVGVCSRNLDLTLNQEGNSFVDMAKKSGLLEKLKEYCVKNNRSLAVQGELVGPGIQGNKDALPEVGFYVFDIFDIDKYKYVNPTERKRIVTELFESGANINHVPVLLYKYSLNQMLEEGFLTSLTIAGLLKAAEGKSYFGLTQSEREGLVFKRMDGQFSFKAISNKFLMKYDE